METRPGLQRVQTEVKGKPLFCSYNLLLLLQERTPPRPCWACVALWPRCPAPSPWPASSPASAWSTSAPSPAPRSPPARSPPARPPGDAASSHILLPQPTKTTNSLLLFLFALSARLLHSVCESSANFYVLCRASAHLFEFPSFSLFNDQILFCGEHLWFHPPLGRFIHCPPQIQTKTGRESS